MDLATLIGYLLAWGSLAYGAYHASHGAIGAYIKPGEMILVGGCALGATLASMPFASVMGAVMAGKKCVLNKHVHIDHLIKEIVQYAETARRDGVLALEQVAREAPDAFLRRGLQLTIDGTDPELIERIMRIEVDAMLERHKHGKHFWASLAKFGPGCGLVACLTAQVAMFRNLNGDAAVIGAALAVALVGTLYGALLQNLIAGPIAEKLGILSKEEGFEKEIILQGVLSIQAGNNPRVVEMQLLSFLSAKQQALALKQAA
ncbi:MAG: MotA/TolQ/ExbB proton channel family protein [Burkholderiales bacterium]|nr:MotA/TolQ/ExbB proton channel family protein [Phycisphaerae bacterium]